MRILVTIPHYHASSQEPGSPPPRHASETASAARRAAAVTRCILALHHHFGPAQHSLNIARRELEAANHRRKTLVHVVLCTVERQHLVGKLPIATELYQHQVADIEPRLLGFQCRRILRDRWGNYDFYCYVEDDLIVHDPWFFDKLAWFNQHLGDDKLLLPNRYECGDGPLPHKLYVDGDLAPHVTSRWSKTADAHRREGLFLGQPVFFERPLNPHSGCYFLNARQMEAWIRQPHFADIDTSFVGPLESAATLGVLRTFAIYKAARANAHFLEVQHDGTGFLSLFPPPAPGT